VLTGPFRFEYTQHEALGELAEALDIARISFREKELLPLEPLLNRKKIFKKFGSLTVELPPAAFLQASEEGEKALSYIVVKHAGDSATIADLFSGCGTFAGVLAENAKVTAADSASDAMTALIKARHPNIKIHRRDLFKAPLTATELAGFDCIVFDPPRAGAKEQAFHIAQTAIPKVISVSCNPATFARDAKILQDGGYRLQSATIVDQFVYSAHTEVAGLFTIS
jgi:23S rRNA (uracil1939-C5)-methyltransferase